MKKKTIVISIVVFVIIVILLPVLVDWFIIGNNIPSHVSNKDWVSFLGGYIGAILGAAVSLIGIIITIRYTNEQNKIDRELQIRPYCSIRYVHDNKLVGTNKILGELLLGCEPKENNGPEYTSILYLKNIGLGPAIEFEFDIDEIEDGRKHYLAFSQCDSEVSNKSVNLLQPGEEAAFPIRVYFNFDPISEEDFIETGEGSLFKYDVKPSIMQKYKNFNIVMHVKYYDMYQNQYYQKITLSSNMYIGGENGKQIRHLCDLNLKEITFPMKIRR